MKYLVAIHHRDDYDAAANEDEARIQAITDLNKEMIAAGVRFFAGGLQRAGQAKALRQIGGKVIATDGPYLETYEHIGGFWILDCANMDEAQEWGRKAVIACNAPVEVREFGRNSG